MNRFGTLLFLWLPFMTSVSTYTPCTVPCIESASPNQLKEVELRLYTGPTIANYTTVLIVNAADLIVQMDTSKQTIVYIFGYMSDPSAENVLTVVGALFETGDHNIILVDWNEIAKRPYPYAAKSVDGVGYYMAGALRNLISVGLNLATLYIVGHSLGAQTAGFIGRYMNGSVPRITGLDPAGPAFYYTIQNLAASDAGFVDVIHSDAGNFGTLFSGASVDYYPNGGINPQPGCLTSGTLSDICSHSRAWALYGDSVRYPNSTIGVKCNSYPEFQAGNCTRNEKIVMGYGAPLNASGDVYLQTNNASIYGRGDAGTTYDPSLSNV